MKDTGRRVLDDLYLLEGFARKSRKQAVAEVQFRRNEGMDQAFSGLHGESTPN